MFKPKQQLLQKLRWKQQQQQQQHLSLTAVKKARLSSSVTDAAAVSRAGIAICCSEWIGDKIAVKADAWNDNSGIGWHLQQVCIQMSTHGGRAVCHTTTRTSFAIPRQKLCSLIAPGLTGRQLDKAVLTIVFSTLSSAQTAVLTISPSPFGPTGYFPQSTFFDLAWKSNYLSIYPQSTLVGRNTLRFALRWPFAVDWA